MDKTPVPIITQADFPAFKAILKSHLPGKTWDEWFQHNKEFATNLEKQGTRVKPVPADPHEFARYLHRTGKGHDLNSFGLYLMEKAFGNGD